MPALARDKETDLMQTVNSILFVLFCGITGMALLAAVNLLLPVKVKTIQAKLESHLPRSFVTGLVALFILVAILILLGYIINLPVFKTRISPNAAAIVLGNFLMPGIFVLLFALDAFVLVVFCVLGLTALANDLGRRMGKNRTAFKSFLLGALLLILAGLAPFVGWFVFAPIAVCTGMGATVQVIFQRKPSPALPE
jgi:hypothetical protein